MEYSNIVLKMLGALAALYGSCQAIYAARDVARAHGEIWVVTGPLFLPNSPASETVEYLMIGKTPVPTHYFFVIARKTAVSGVEVQGFIVPNVFTFDSREQESFFASVRSIEEASGLDLFPELPEQVQSVMEEATPEQKWSVTDG